MAAEIQMGGVEDDRIFIGTDFTRDFQVLDLDTDASGATAKDVTGQVYTFDIRKRDQDNVPAKLSATMTVVGVFDTVAADSTQRLRWTCLAAHLTTALFGLNGGRYRYSLKRTTTSLHTVVQFGDIIIQRATQV